MLTEFTRTISIKPDDLARELVESGDLLAIGSFLMTMSAHLSAAANKGFVPPLTNIEKTRREISDALALGLSGVVGKIMDKIK